MQHDKTYSVLPLIGHRPDAFGQVLAFLLTVEQQVLQMIQAIAKQA